MSTQQNDPGLPPPAEVSEARSRIARHLAELMRLQEALTFDMQALKTFSVEGTGIGEIRLAAETLTQYLSIADTFLENMHKRLEYRLGVLRRAEPALDTPRHETAHLHFWLEFSALTAVLRRIERRRL